MVCAPRMPDFSYVCVFVYFLSGKRCVNVYRSVCDWKLRLIIRVLSFPANSSFEHTIRKFFGPYFYRINVFSRKMRKKATPQWILCDMHIYFSTPYENRRKLNFVTMVRGLIFSYRSIIISFIPFACCAYTINGDGIAPRIYLISNERIKIEPNDICGCDEYIADTVEPLLEVKYNVCLLSIRWSVYFTNTFH